MTLTEVQAKLSHYEMFQTLSGLWVIQVFSTPWDYREYRFSEDGKLESVWSYEDGAVQQLPLESVLQ